MSTPTEYQQKFRQIVERIFNNWQDLRLAVEHGMGGRNGQETAIQIMDYTYQYCIGNENITEGELQEVIEDLMDEEFNTICDDLSIPEIARNLLRYKQLCLQNQYDQIATELSKLPAGKEWLRPDVKISYIPVEGESSAEDESGSDDDMDIDDSDGLEEKATCSRATRSQARRKEQETFVEPEEGWTTVRRK